MVILDRKYYRKALEALTQVKVNHLFARFVAEEQITGTIYADHAEKPQTFYIVHPYGMSLLLGNTEQDGFNEKLRDYLLNNSRIRNKVEWMQAYPAAWNNKMEQLLGDRLVKHNPLTVEPPMDKVEVNTRANFRFNPDKFLDFKKSHFACDYPIVRTDRELFEKMRGAVVPRYFWDNADDFYKKGIGFSIVIDDKPVSTAYSAYIFDHQLELGIETSAEYRGKGLALYTCSALIDYCLQNKYEPIWSCRFENKGSYNLAQKLGFEPTVTLPYYRLPV